MNVSHPNENGVYPESTAEVVARHGRSFAELGFAHCDDGRFRFAVSIHYSYGGFSGPIFVGAPSFGTMAAARSAGLENLLARWPRGYSSYPTR